MPAYCEISYAMTVTPQLAPPNDQAIALVEGTRSVTIDLTSADAAILGDYSIAITAVTPASESADTGVGWTWNASIRSLCAEATLTIDPSMVPQPYEYVASQTQDIQTLDA